MARKKGRRRLVVRSLVVFCKDSGGRGACGGRLAIETAEQGRRKGGKVEGEEGTLFAGMKGQHGIRR